jgi:hypothetical protein
MNYVCAQCGHRQSDDVDCRGCGQDVVHDIRERRTRDFLRDVEMRIERKRADRIRMVSVVIALAIIFSLLTTEFWWELRRATIGLPMLFDQWIYAGLIAAGLMKLAENHYADKKRFPFLAEAWEEELET